MKHAWALVLSMYSVFGFSSIFCPQSSQLQNAFWHRMACACKPDGRLCLPKSTSHASHEPAIAPLVKEPVTAYIMACEEGSLTVRLLWVLSVAPLGTAASAEMSAASRPFRF